MYSVDATFLTLIYVSTARRLFSDDELATLLGSARAKNRRLGITGMLAYCGGNFLQVLEGPPVVVRAVYREIARDPRHVDVQCIAELPTARRGFPDWAMAYGFCPTAAEFQGCVNLLRNGGAALKGRLTGENPLRPLVLGFIEDNLPGFDPGVVDAPAADASSASRGR